MGRGSGGVSTLGIFEEQPDGKYYRAEAIETFSTIPRAEYALEKMRAARKYKDKRLTIHDLRECAGVVRW